MHQLIAPQSLRDLVDAKAIRHATVVADRNVFKIVVKVGTAEKAVSVRTRDGQFKERLFASLDAAARFMREKIHLDQYEVNAANFEPMSTQGKRPDTAQRLKQAHAALSHAEWLEAKVQAARAGLEDGTNRIIDEEEWKALRAARQARRDAA
jgi:hypothetical protein